ncbi:MAG: tetratricopeptide repeat protein [Candidatus Bathyarchaeia archaeon]
MYCPILENTRTPVDLVEKLRHFLEVVFGRTWLEQELSKARFKPRGEPEDFSFLMDVNIHQAAKWWRLCNLLKERSYKFDLRFMTDLEDFMELLLFCCNLNTLLERGIISLEDQQIIGRLKDKERFTDLLYELLIATNYVTQNYKVEFPEITGKGRVDVYVEQDKVRTFIECKKLGYTALWNATARQFLKEAAKRGFNVAIIVEVERPPQKYPEAVKLAKLMVKVVEQKLPIIQERDVKIGFQPLLELIEGGKFEVPLDISRTDYLTWSGYIGFFQDGVKIRDPKVVAFKDMVKARRAREKLRKNLKKAYKQLLSVTEGYRIICVDVSSIIGKIVAHIGRQKLEQEEIGELVKEAKEWLMDHKEIHAIILTWTKIYIDPLGTPTFIVVETVPITSGTEISTLPLFKGWTLMVSILLLPEPIDARILTNIGTFLAENGFYGRALKYYELVVKTNQYSKEVWNNMGRALNELGKFREALRCLEKALVIDPRYPSPWVNKGISLANLGNVQEALDCFNKAIELNPNFAKAWYNKGLILFKLNKVDEAELCAKEALRIDPRYDKAKELERLRGLRKAGF